MNRYEEVAVAAHRKYGWVGAWVWLAKCRNNNLISEATARRVVRALVGVK